MHRESITEALLGTALIFNTVFEIPAGTSLPGQMFGAGIVFWCLLQMIEAARAWERKMSAGRPPRRTHRKYIQDHYEKEWGKCQDV